MKNLTLLLSAWFVLVGALPAGVQDLNVTPATLVDWQLKGADRERIQAQDSLKLPAGAEISRTFSGGAVVTYSISRPHFGSSADDWPVMQVGPAALTLTRKGIRGELVLLIGDVVSALPVEVPLDASGNALQPLEIALGYDPAAKVGIVAFADQALSFKGVASGSTLEVVLAAGERSAWTQDSLEVLVIGPDKETDAAKGAEGVEADGRAALLRSAAEKLQQAGEVIGGQKGSDSDATKPKQTNVVSTLEIFTPPAVRHGVAGVRAAIAQSQKK